jgi:hypothetical protein
MQAVGLLTLNPSPEMKPMAKLSKDAQVLQYFIQRAPGGALGVTHLQKLAYLADLFAREYLGTPVTGFDYVWHKHGPFDQRIYDAVDELERAGLAKERPGFVWYGRWKREIRSENRLTEFEVSPEEAAILDFVAERYEAMPLDKVLDEVYSTEPMLAVKDRGRGVRLPMDPLNNRFKDQFDLPALLHEEAEVKRGNYVLADDFFDALRAEAVAWDAGVD